MSDAGMHLHVVTPSAPAEAESGLEDLGITALIFAVSLLPLVCDAAHLGHWGAGSLGVGTAGALLSGRELVAWLVRELARKVRSRPVHRPRPVRPARTRRSPAARSTAPSPAPRRA